MRICRYTKRMFRQHVGFTIGNTYFYEIKEDPNTHAYGYRSPEKRVFLYNLNLKEMASISIVRFKKSFIDLSEERSEKINKLLNDISS